MRSLLRRSQLLPSLREATKLQRFPSTKSRLLSTINVNEETGTVRFNIKLFPDFLILTILYFDFQIKDIGERKSWIPVSNQDLQRITIQVIQCSTVALVLSNLNTVIAVAYP